MAWQKFFLVNKGTFKLILRHKMLQNSPTSTFNFKGSCRTCRTGSYGPVWGRNLTWRSGASPPEAKSSLAFESPAAEQNVPDSGYVAVHTGVNHKAFCNQVSD